jgi:hypothetical protein
VLSNRPLSTSYWQSVWESSLVRVGKLGNKAATQRPDAWGPYPGDASRDPSQNYPASHYPPRWEG